MKRIAEGLGPAVGKEVHIVSITVDPEHDHPAQLLADANDEGGQRQGMAVSDRKAAADQ